MSSTSLFHSANTGTARGGITALAATCLAAAVLAGIGATLAFSSQQGVVKRAHAVVAGDAAAGPVATHALPVSHGAETYSESNPQPPTF